MQSSPRLGLAPGRRLIWAPDWSCSDGRIAFDAASGDFWILSPIATALVRALAERPEVTDAEWLSALTQRVRAETGEALDEVPEQVIETLMREHLLASA
jgi:PqqD family protein of HPr-rel-A system